MARWTKLVEKGKPYAIYYFDHYAQPSKGAWVRPSKITASDTEIVTLGWAVKETQNYIALASTVDKVYDPSEAVGGVWMITKGAITNIIPLNTEAEK